MGRVGPGLGRARGGDGVQALRASRVRVATGLASLGLVAALCAYAVLAAPAPLRPLVAFPASAALLSVAAAVARGWAPLLPWGLASCLATYGAGLVARAEGVDAAAPLFAAGLLAAAELAYWSVEERAPGARAPAARRAALVAALSLATAGLGSLLLVAALVRPAGGPALLALGVAAAVATVGLLARLARAAGP